MLAHPERVERGRLVGLQGEVEDAQVLRDAPGIAGPRDGDDALLLHLPAQHDLGRGSPMPLGRGGDGRFGKELRSPPRQ